jgi:hypothetical protein
MTGTNINRTEADAEDLEAAPSIEDLRAALEDLKAAIDLAEMHAVARRRLSASTLPPTLGGKRKENQP